MATKALPTDWRSHMGAEIAARIGGKGRIIAPEGQSVATFAKHASRGRWMEPPHLTMLVDKLTQVAEGKVKRLMVFMPPRHGKSETISRYFAAWFVGRYADKRVILTSYEASFAASWGRKARDLLEAHGQGVFGVNVSAKSSAADSWEIDGHTGSMNTAGVGGPITGKGADLFIIDDPLKNAEEAASETIREKQWDWYKSTAYTRLEPGAAMILIMTRWHEDDLAGRLLLDMQEGGDKWEVLSLCAIAESNDPLERPEGSPLWPARFDEQALAGIRQTLGSYYWYAMYQQQPQPAGGSIFQRSWFRYYHREMMPTGYADREEEYFSLHTPAGHTRYKTSDCIVFQTCDPAATEKEQSDWFVLTTWAVTPQRDLLVLDVFREKAETAKHKEIMRRQYDRWQPSFIGVENKTFGLNIIQECKVSGLPIIPLPADKDKVSRARTMAARYEVGAVYHLQGAPWLTEWENEFVGFPNAKHDDQVDTGSQAAAELISIGRVPTKEEQEELDEFDAREEAELVAERLANRSGMYY